MSDETEFPSDGPPPPRAPRRVGRRPLDTEPAADPRRPKNTETSVGRATGDSYAEHQPDAAESDFAELQVSALFVLGALAIIFFCVAYFTVPLHRELGQYSNFALGGSLAIALFATGAGFIVWAKKLLPHQASVQDRHEFASSPADREASEATFFEGVDDMGLGKRKILRRTLLGVLGVLPIPAVILARDLGPLPHDSLIRTGWRKGTRLVDLDTKLPVKAGDLAIGGMKTVMPEGFDDVNEDALSPTVLIRFAPGEIASVKERQWSAQDHVAYSKICTHAGCPISLYEQQTHHLLCPCHQSTFDMAHDAKVIFGPAARPLPQLRIYIDSAGYFRATGPYTQAVGPSFWERR